MAGQILGETERVGGSLHNIVFAFTTAWLHSEHDVSQIFSLLFQAGGEIFENLLRFLGCFNFELQFFDVPEL